MAWLKWLSVLPLVLLSFLLLEFFGDHEPQSRQLLYDTLKIVCGLWIAGLLWPVIHRKVIKRRLPEDNSIARRIGWGNDSIRDRFLNGLQVLEAGEKNEENYDDELITASLDQVMPRLEELDLSNVLPYASRRRGLKFLAISFVVGALLVVSGGKNVRLAFSRLTDPQADFRGAAPFSLEIDLLSAGESLKNGSDNELNVIHGDPVSVTVRHAGKELPVDITLYSKNVSQGINSWPLDIRRGSAVLDDIRIDDNTIFWAEANYVSNNRRARVSSDSLGCVLQNPPVLDSLKIKVRPPYYTKLPAWYQASGDADILCPVGSQLTLEWNSSKTVSNAELVFDPESGLSKLDLFAAGSPGHSDGEVQFRAKSKCAWWIDLIDADQLKNRRPLKHSIRVIPDRSPRLKMISPRENEGALDPGMRIGLVALAEDDYGFSRMRLVWKVVSSVTRDLFKFPELENIENIPGGWSEKDLELKTLGASGRAALDMEWDLNELALFPDDELYFYLELFDNDGWNGVKSGRSVIYIYKVPGIEELFAEVGQDQDKIVKQAEEVYEKTKENTRKLKELKEELKRDPEMTWQRQQKLKQLVKEQEKNLEQAKDVSKKLESLSQKMEKNQMISEELRDKMQKLKSMLDEIIDPEMLEKLRKAAEQAMQKPGEKKNNRPMQDMEEVLKSMEQQLDRFLAVLEQMQMEERLEELARRAEDMLKRQRDVNKRLDKPASQDRNVSEEEKLKHDAKQLQKDIQKTAEEFSDKESYPQKEMDQAGDFMEQQEIDQQMQDMQEQMQQDESAAEQGEQIDQDLNQLSEMLQSALDKTREQAKENLAKEIDRVCQELLVVSLSQEGVNAETKNLSRRSARIPALAEISIENKLGLLAISNAVYELTRNSFHIPKQAVTMMGNSVNMVDEILVAYHDRSIGNLSRKGSSLMGQINSTILLLKQSKQQMQNSSSSTGFEEMLEKMAQASAKQQCLNGQCNKLMCNKPGQSEKPMSISFSESAKEQSGIRKDIESLSEKVGEDGKPKTGDLGKIASDMKEVEKDLENQIYTERTQKLQERILTRLLDAQRSLRRQDQSKKRESRTAKALKASSPPPLDDTERASNVQRDLQRALDSGYSPEMEELIRDYFRAIEDLDQDQRNH
jgi:hypothetical protein